MDGETLRRMRSDFDVIRKPSTYHTLVEALDISVRTVQRWGRALQAPKQC